MFRANRDGALVEVGARTQKMFDMYGIDRAQQILGQENWDSIIAAPHANNGTTVFFEAEGADYLVTHAPTANDEINFYLTRLPR